MNGKVQKNLVFNEDTLFHIFPPNAALSLHSAVAWMKCVGCDASPLHRH